jgi:hypothetical protein
MTLMTAISTIHGKVRDFLLDTQARLNDAQARDATAVAAHAAAVQAFGTATVAGKRAARDAMDDAEAARYEAGVALEEATTAHAAATKAAKLSQLRAEQDAANEAPRLVAKSIDALVASFAPCLRHISDVETTLRSYADRSAAARQLASETGESVSIVPFSVGQALALALERFSTAEGATYDRSAALRWLMAIPDPVARQHEILRLCTGMGAKPVDVELAEAAALAIKDPAAPQALSNERQEAKARPAREYAAREDDALSKLTRDERAEYHSLDGTPEERAAKIITERSKRKAEIERLALESQARDEWGQPQNVLARDLARVRGAA